MVSEETGSREERDIVADEMVLSHEWNEDWGQITGFNNEEEVFTGKLDKNGNEGAKCD